MYNVVISALVGFAAGVVVVLALLDNFNHDKERPSQNTFSGKAEKILVNVALDLGEINRLKEKIAQLESLNEVPKKLAEEDMDAQVLDCSAAIHSAIQAADKKMNL